MVKEIYEQEQRGMYRPIIMPGNGSDWVCVEKIEPLDPSQGMPWEYKDSAISAMHCVVAKKFVLVVLKELLGLAGTV
jgi:hypothetical protein